MKKYLFIFLVIAVSFGLIAADAPDAGWTWHDVFSTLILGVVALVGSPITQLIKNVLKIEDGWALLLTGVIAGGFAVLEMFLAGQLSFDKYDLQNLPNAFFAVFTLGSIYFAMFKNSKSVLGQGFLLKSRE